jgi:phytoene/squalene synthetase
MEASSDGAERSLELIRDHCDNGLRYYTWALARMPAIPEQAQHVGQVRNLRSSLAHVLAYVEGAGDERRAMVARDEIIQRYIAAVDVEGGEPPFASGELR